MRRFKLSLLAGSLLLLPTVAAAESFTQDLDIGSQGPQVSFLQEVLCQDRQLFPDCLIDGIFDPSTQAAVVRFQYRMGIRDPDVLGRVESATRALLNARIEDRDAATFNADAIARQNIYLQIRDPESMLALQAALQKRAESMTTLLSTNERKAEEFCLPKSYRKRVPKPLRSLVEEDEAKLKGIVIEQIEDQPSPPYAVDVRRYIKTSRGELYAVPRSDKRLHVGSRVQARGMRMGQYFIPDNEADAIRPIGSDVTSAALPPVEHLAVSLVDFHDAPHEFSSQEIEQAMDAIRTYYETASYGKTTVQIQISGWHRSTHSVDDLNCDRDGFLAEAMQLANDDIDFGAQTVFMGVTPLAFGTRQIGKCAGDQGISCTLDQACPTGTGPCTGGCRGPGAGGAHVGPQRIKTPDGTVSIGDALVTEGIVLVDGTLRPRTQVHEFSHTRGLQHSNALLCPGTSFAADVVTTSCTEVSDSIELMGCCHANDLNPFHKELLGWLDGQALQVVTSPGTFRLGVYERSTNEVKVLKIPGPRGHSFYVQYRQPEGNDASFVAASWVDGARIYVDGPLAFEGTAGDSWLVSATPNSADPPQNVFRTGQTFFDSESAWAVTPVARDANGLTVSVSRVSPTFSCSPAVTEILTGQAITFTAGGVESAVNWTATGATPATGSGVTFSTSFSQAGQFTVGWAFPGGNGATASCSVKVVNPSPTFSCSPAVTKTETGSTVVFAAKGVPATVNWTAVGATPPTGAGATFRTSFLQAGQYTVTWSAPGGATASCSVEVADVPTNFSCSPAHTKTLPESVVAFSARGLQIPVNWTAVGGMPATGTGASFSTSFAQLGQYTVKWTLPGTSITRSCSVEVVPAPVVRQFDVNGTAMAVSNPESTDSGNMVTLQDGDPLHFMWNALYADYCSIAWFIWQAPVQGNEACPDQTSANRPWNGWNIPGYVGNFQYLGDLGIFCGNNATSAESSFIPAYVARGSATVPESPSGYNAKCVLLSAPSHLNRGDTFQARVVMENTGTQPWVTDASPIRLAFRSPQMFADWWDADHSSHADTDRWGSTRQGLPGTVQPGESAEFVVHGMAQVEPGYLPASHYPFLRYPFFVQMVEDTDQGPRYFGNECQWYIYLPNP